LDLERYADYNDYEEDASKSKSPIIIVLKIIIAIVCIGVVGVIGFRIFLFNTYPDKIENIYFNDKLSAYYNEKDGDIGALTQNLSTPYDDSDKGRFFCDNLILIKGIGQLQVSLRYNDSLEKILLEELGKEIDIKSEETFSFRLVRNPISDEEGAEPIVIGSLSDTLTDSLLMYNYYKPVFDGIDFADGTEGEIKWIRLEVTVNGVEMEKPYMILIYENNERYSSFEDYQLSKGEKPE
jgi:hypothetical protein